MSFQGIFLLTILLVFSLIVIGGQPENLEVSKVKELWDKGHWDLILDVRTSSEFDGGMGHVPGAKQISVQMLPFNTSEIEEFKSKNIAVICQSGARSSMAIKILKMKGFENVTNVEGGTIAWKNAGYPIEYSKK